MNNRKNIAILLLMKLELILITKQYLMMIILILTIYYLISHVKVKREKFKSNQLCKVSSLTQHCQSSVIRKLELGTD